MRPGCLLSHITKITTKYLFHFSSAKVKPMTRWLSIIGIKEISLAFFRNEKANRLNWKHSNMYITSDKLFFSLYLFYSPCTLIYTQIINVCACDHLCVFVSLYLCMRQLLLTTWFANIFMLSFPKYQCNFIFFFAQSTPMKHLLEWVTVIQYAFIIAMQGSVLSFTGSDHRQKTH